VHVLMSPPAEAESPPFDLARATEIRLKNTLSHYKIQTVDLRLNGLEQNPVSCTHELGLWTLIHGRVDLFHHFFNRKLIHKFQKITGALDFLQKHP
jgi:hypothetical protein